MSPKTNQTPFLTVEEIAQYLKVRKSWIYEKTRLGEIPYIKIGKYLRFRAEEVEKALVRKGSLKTKLVQKCRP